MRSVGRADAGSRATTIQGLQHRAGNAVVQRLVGGQAVQRRHYLETDNPSGGGGAAASQVHQAGQGLGTDEAQLLASLRSLRRDARRIAEFKATFLRRYGETAESYVRSELSGSDLAEALTLLTPLPATRAEAGADAANRLHAAFEGLGTDEAAVFAVLRELGHNAERIAALRSTYLARFGETIEDALRSEMSGSELATALALLVPSAPSSDPEHPRREAPASAGGTLRVGSRGDAVSALQQALNVQLGLSLSTDGVFGARTAAAVRAFQASRGLVADGVVGPATRAALAGG
jgi:hypothetical protein